ncbi:hypothetical protein BOTBODRAFT_534340 [Botryobasidium botryosum FD-172 SS1]|uniref:EamA domain-containing protein n=1 Tax=Botryobasidium botryosum (strain FD-172 SS1) TaxID=930990 RepID=A0A067M0W6_BOTB1|nr:hypothetical protein BOTBODRAFT_534340 [Botryobasidium botryosum FD-172 SS1]
MAPSPPSSHPIFTVYERNKGLLLIALSQLFFSLMNFFVKLFSSLANPVPALQLIVIRMSITFVLGVAYMTYAKVPYPVLGPSGVRLWLVLRGAVGFFGLFGVYYSLQYLSLSDATVISFLSPSVTAVLGYFLLKESFSIREGIAGLISLTGVFLVARPEFVFGALEQYQSLSSPVESTFTPERGTPSQRLGAVGVALIGVLGAAGAYTTVRYISTKPTAVPVHALHNVSYLAAWCALLSGSILASGVLNIELVWPGGDENGSFALWVAAFFAIGITGFFGQLLLTMGLARESAGRGSLALYTQILFAGLLEHTFLKNTAPSILSVLGTCLILSSAIFVTLTKKKSSSSSLTPMPGGAGAEAHIPLTTLTEDDGDYQPHVTKSGYEPLRHDAEVDDRNVDLEK